MKSNRTESASRRFVVEAIVVVSCLSWVGLFAAEPEAPSNKIQFTDPKDDFRIPLDDSNGGLSSKSFEFLDRQSSLSGVIAPNLGPTVHSTPNGAPSTRILELYQRRLDEKKNWIYRRADDSRSQPTLEEMFGVRGSTAGAEQRNRSVVADYFEGPSKKAQRPVPRDEGQDPFQRNRDSKPFELNLSGGNRTETPGGVRFESALDGRGLVRTEFSIQNGFVAPDPIRPDDSLDPMFRRSRSQGREQESRPDDFGRLLITQTGINPLAPGFDPINLSVDATRQQLNPVSPIGLEMPVVGAGISAEAVSGGAVGHTRAGVFSGSGVAGAGSSSLTPVISSSPEPARVKHQPILLDFPKRKL